MFTRNNERFYIESLSDGTHVVYRHQLEDKNRKEAANGYDFAEGLFTLLRFYALFLE